MKLLLMMIKGIYPHLLTRENRGQTTFNFFHPTKKLFVWMQKTFSEQRFEKKCGLSPNYSLRFLRPATISNSLFYNENFYLRCMALF